MENDGKTHTSLVVMNTSLCQHGVILNFRLPERRTVVWDEDEFSFARSKRFESGFVAQCVFATLHHKSKTSVDALLGLFLNSSKGTEWIEEHGIRGKAKEERVPVSLRIPWWMLYYGGCGCKANNSKEGLRVRNIWKMTGPITPLYHNRGKKFLEQLIAGRGAPTRQIYSFRQSTIENNVEA